MKIIKYILLLLFFFLSVAYANEKNSNKILKIFIYGNKRIEKGVIINVIQSKKGNEYSEKTVSNDIQAIYKLGVFEDIKLKVEESYQGKIIFFIVKEKPALKTLL